MPKREFRVQHEPRQVLRLRPPLSPSLYAGAAPTANERFKETFRPSVGVGVVAALSLHVAIIALMPSVRTAEARPMASPSIASIDIPPRVSVPAPPQPVARPARPTIGDVALSRELTIEPTTFESFERAEAVGALAPPPTNVRSASDGRPPYIPFEVAPVLRNKDQSLALLQNVYPTQLRDAGISGTVYLWINVDENGVVRDTQIERSSGYPDLDIAAQTVAHAMRFTPALMRDKPAAVWISQQIDFIARRPGPS